MTTYWVIAPYSSDFPEILEKVWQYNLSTGVISLGWRELGNRHYKDSEKELGWEFIVPRPEL